MGKSGGKSHAASWGESRANPEGASAPLAGAHPGDMHQLARRPLRIEHLLEVFRVRTIYSGCGNECLAA